jgi:hypothetical protein
MRYLACAEGLEEELRNENASIICSLLLALFFIALPSYSKEMLVHEI